MLTGKIAVLSKEKRGRIKGVRYFFCSSFCSGGLVNGSRGSKDEECFLACPEFVEGKHTIRSTLYAKLYDIRNTRYDIRTSIQNTVPSLGDFSAFHSKSNLFYGIIRLC